MMKKTMPALKDTTIPEPSSSKGKGTTETQKRKRVPKTCDRVRHMTPNLNTSISQTHVSSTFFAFCLAFFGSAQNIKSLAIEGIHVRVATKRAWNALTNQKRKPFCTS